MKFLLPIYFIIGVSALADMRIGHEYTTRRIDADTDGHIFNLDPVISADCVFCANFSRDASTNFYENYFGNDCYATNVTTMPLWDVAGSGSVLFDGVNDMIYREDADNLRIGTNLGWTICAWVNYRGTNVQHGIIAKGGIGGTAAQQNPFNYFLKINTLGRLDAGCQVSSATSYVNRLSNAGLAPTATWFHAAAIYTGGKTGIAALAVYTNAVQVGGYSYNDAQGVIYASITNASALGPTPLRLGFWVTNDFRVINGYLDGVMIFNRPLTVNATGELGSVMRATRGTK